MYRRAGTGLWGRCTAGYVFGTLQISHKLGSSWIAPLSVLLGQDLPTFVVPHFEISLDRV